MSSQGISSLRRVQLGAWMSKVCSAPDCTAVGEKVANTRQAQGNVSKQARILQVPMVSAKASIVHSQHTSLSHTQNGRFLVISCHCKKPNCGTSQLGSLGVGDKQIIVTNSVKQDLHRVFKFLTYAAVCRNDLQTSCSIHIHLHRSV